MAQVNILRMRDAFEGQKENLYTKLGDWSQWDDTYQFINDQNEEYLDSNLQDPTFEILKINLVAIVDTEGKVLFGKEYRSERQPSVPLPQSLTEILSHQSFFRPTQTDGQSGILTLPEGVLVFAFRPVTSSDGASPTNGGIFFGYYLDADDEQSLSDLVHFEVSIDRFSEFSQKGEVYRLVADDLRKQPVLVPRSTKEASTLWGYATLPEAVSSEPAVVLSARLDRKILAQGQQSIEVFLKTMGVAAGVITLVVLALFEFIALRKLSRLEKGVVKIRKSKSTHQLVDEPSTNDEFSSLTNEINRSLKALYESEARLEEQRNELKKFQLAAEKSFNHLVITDADGVVMYANPAASKNTGYSNEEIIGQKPSLWGKQMPRKVYEEMWRTIKEEKRPYFGELKNKRKDGTCYLASASITPITDSRGVVRYFVGIERDITEERAQQERDRKNMEELEKMNNRLSSEKARAEGILRYLRSIGGGVYATDKRGMVVFVNDQAAKIIGKNPDEILGEDAVNFFKFCEGVEKEVPCLMPTQLAVTSGEMSSFPRGTFLLSDRESFPVSGTYSPIVEKNHIAGVIVVFQDISEYYKLEKMKESFLSIAAHQLRTPLGSMRWSMELLLNGDLGKIPKKAEKVLGQLYENSARMLTIVKDLLNVSKIDQKKTKDDFVETDIPMLVAQVVETMKGAAEKKGIALEMIQSSEEFRPIAVTRNHLFEAIENLIANAIRYNREAGRVTVTLKRSQSDIVIEVADTGIGIPKTDQNKIFSKFYRASNAVRHYTDGSGLGLAVVKSYVEENNGTVSFKSKENEGAVFFVSLPM
jgi:PAS domain S-box-containing protein